MRFRNFPPPPPPRSSVLRRNFVFFSPVLFNRPLDRPVNVHSSRFSFVEKRKTGTVDVWWLCDDGGTCTINVMRKIQLDTPIVRRFSVDRRTHTPVARCVAAMHVSYFRRFRPNRQSRHGEKQVSPMTVRVLIDYGGRREERKILLDSL